MSGLVEINPASTQDVPERAGVYLLTHPRSASNLFQTMMEKQPGYQISGYKLFEAAYMPLMSVGSGPLSEKPVEEREKMYEAFRKGAKDIEAEIADAKSKGLQVFVKEHVILLHGADKMFKAVWPTDTIPPLILESDPKTPHTNPSTLPDSLLLSLQPIFQIRNPVLMFPSLIRAQRDTYNPNVRPSDKVFKLMLTLRHSRELYDWYLTHAPADRKPRVIDADDIMNDKDAVHKLCVQTGLDPSAVQYEWDAKPEFDDPLKKRFLSTISNSKGIIPGLAAKGLDFEKEREKWRKEFGDEGGEELARFVEKSMEDYEYLLSQRTRGGNE